MVDLSQGSKLATNPIPSKPLNIFGTIDVGVYYERGMGLGTLWLCQNFSISYWKLPSRNSLIHPLKAWWIFPVRFCSRLPGRVDHDDDTWFSDRHIFFPQKHVIS